MITNLMMHRQTGGLTLTSVLPILPTHPPQTHPLLPHPASTAISHHQWDISWPKSISTLHATSGRGRQQRKKCGVVTCHSPMRGRSSLLYSISDCTPRGLCTEMKGSSQPLHGCKPAGITTYRNNRTSYSPGESLALAARQRRG